MQLQLSLPDEITDTLVDETPKQLQQWLSQLPVGNMPETLQMTVLKIRRLNRGHLSPTVRYRLLQTLSSLYRDIAQYYRTGSCINLDSVDMIDDEQRQQFRQLTTEMAYGYKILSMSLPQKRLWVRKPHTLLTCTLRESIYYLGLLLLDNYEKYSTESHLIWNEIHQLYHYALFLQIAHKQEKRNDIQSSINARYLQVLLFSLVDPYRLGRGEHSQVHHFLSIWSHKAQLTKQLNAQSKYNCFMVSLNSQEKPIQLQHELEQLEEGCFLLTTFDFNALIDTFLQQLASGEITPHELGFSPQFNQIRAQNLLRIMQKSWFERPPRVKPRQPQQRQLLVAWGLPSVHRLLQINDNEKQMERIIPFVQHLQDISPYWESRNISAGGMCLMQSSNAVQHLHIGMIAAIGYPPSEGHHSQWTLAALRWLNGENDKTELGLEVIEGRAHEAWLQVVDKGLDQHLYPVIHIISRQQSHPAILVAPKGVYKYGRQYKLHSNDHELVITANAPHEFTPELDYFIYDVQSDNAR